MSRGRTETMTCTGWGPAAQSAPISAFKMASGEEVIFAGIRTGKLAQMTGVPPEVADRLPNNPFGHIVSRPHAVTWNLDGSFNLIRWPAVAASGTCQEVFVADRHVVFQLVEAEIEPRVLRSYRELPATALEG